jgi:VWFA-related protein
MKLLAGLVLAAMVACAQETKTPEYKTRSDLVFLPTLVHKANGDVVYGLKPEQFVVEDNGVRQAVTIEEDPDTAGISLAVVVQCGLSAPAEFAKLKGLGAMINAITGDAPHEVAVASYGERPYLLGDFTSDPDAVSHALAKLAPCGDYHAATIDATDYAVKMLKRRENRYRRAILLVSEMRDHGSRAKLHQVVAELGVSNTVIYCVTFAPTRNEFVSGWRNPAPPPPPKPFSADPAPSPPPAKSEPVETEEYTDHAPLLALPPQMMPIVNALRKNSASELAALSGGEYMSFTNQRSFDRSLDRIANRIHNYYLLSFKPTATATPSLHTLRVRVPDYPGAAVQTRQSYWSGIPE